MSLATTRDPRDLPGGPASARAPILTLLDPAAIIGALWCATWMHDVAFSGPYVILSLIVFALTFPGVSDLASRSHAREAIVGWLLRSCILLLFGYATRSLGAFSQAVVVSWLAAAPFALWAVHRAAGAMLPWALDSQRYRRKAVIVGASDTGIGLARALRDNALTGIRLAGFFDDRARGRLNELDNVPLQGDLSRLPAFVKSHGVDIAYIALPMASQPRILKLLDALRDAEVSIYFVPDIFVTDLIQARVASVGGLPVVAVCETPFHGINGIVKRASDVLLSALILVLIAPLMLAIAVGVKLSSPGPVLFRQRRYGLDGSQIMVYKFRSMTVCEDGPTIRQATRDDQRVTRLGAFLRRTSLDELPQFINVLQGRMSIVGPRPHAVAHNEMYRKLIKGYMMRHKVKPGITGWAQVNGLRGETDTLDKMRARIEYDLAYLRNWSLALDLRIMLRTVAVVIGDRHAY